MRKQDNKRGTAKSDAPLGLLRHLKEVPTDAGQEVKVGDVFTAANTFVATVGAIATRTGAPVAVVGG